jgi:hypothetical protein
LYWTGLKWIAKLTIHCIHSSAICLPLMLNRDTVKLPRTIAHSPELLHSCPSATGMDELAAAGLGLGARLATVGVLLYFSPWGESAACLW